TICCVVLYFDRGYERSHAQLAAKDTVSISIMNHGVRYDVAFATQPRHDDDVYVTDLVPRKLDVGRDLDEVILGRRRFYVWPCLNERFLDRESSFMFRTSRNSYKFDQDCNLKK